MQTNYLVISPKSMSDFTRSETKIVLNCQNFKFFLFKKSLPYQSDVIMKRNHQKADSLVQVWNCVKLLWSMTITIAILCENKSLSLVRVFLCSVIRENCTKLLWQLSHVALDDHSTCGRHSNCVMLPNYHESWRNKKKTQKESKSQKETNCSLVTKAVLS